MPFFGFLGKQLDQSQVIPPGYSSYFSFSSNRIGYSGKTSVIIIAILFNSDSVIFTICSSFFALKFVAGVATFCSNSWAPIKADEGLFPFQRATEDFDVGGYLELSEEEESHAKFANADGRTVLIQNLVQVCIMFKKVLKYRKNDKA